MLDLMRKYTLLIALIIIFSGCASRDFGALKIINIGTSDLRIRVTKFCDVNHRPPKEDEVNFSAWMMPNFFWFISDYVDKKSGHYKVLILDKETNNLIILRDEYTGLTSR